MGTGTFGMFHCCCLLNKTCLITSTGALFLLPKEPVPIGAPVGLPFFAQKPVLFERMT